jgi:hypothetical protein
MIPVFPNFKKIDISDKKDIEEYTNKFKPYSDFNFTSLWSWDISNERMVSKLNDNLIVRFTDYETCEPFFSFLGNNDLSNTALELIHFAENSGVSPVLRFISEEIASSLETLDFFVEEDKDNFDYIFSTSEISELKGFKFKKKRHSADRFFRNNPNAIFEVKEISNPELHSKIVSVFEQWAEKKRIDKNDNDFENEKSAMSRVLQIQDNQNIIVSCIFVESYLVAFSIDEILPMHYSISHFLKADNLNYGVCDFLNKKIAQYLLSKDVLFWSWEQDLGIENLKKSKMSYRPGNFLKKYRVSLINKK